MKIVLLGDLGSAGGYHAGDEAMAEAVVDELASRTSVEVVAISGDPLDTSTRYGWEVVPRVDFSLLTSDSERDARLDAVLNAARGETNSLAWGDPAWKVIHAVAAADAVVISGGGNLSSTWPEHVYERATLALLAALFNKRHVVTGQTLGPQLTARHGELVASVVTSASLVGAREQPSYDVALRLGVNPDRLVRVVDDAAYMQGQSDTSLPTGPYVAATFSPDSGPLDTTTYVEAIAALLDTIAESSGLRIVLIPHHATEINGAVTGDLVTHQAIASASVSADIQILPPLTGREIVAITDNAALVVSSRYHPVVFALGAAVPALGIAVDAYTSTKIHGAMASFGVGDFTVSVGSLLNGGADAAAADLIGRIADIRDHLKRVNTVRKAESAAWWDAVAATLAGADDVTTPADLASVPSFDGLGWSSTTKALRSWSELVSARFSADHLENAAVQADAQACRARADGLEREIATLADDLASSADEIDALRASVAAAHQLISDPLRPVAVWLEDLPSIQALTAELNAIYQTRTFRYLDRPRRIYQRLRH